MLVCKFALLVRDAGVFAQLVEEADILTALIGTEGEGTRYHKIWEMAEDATEFGDPWDGWHIGEKKEWDCKRKHATLRKHVELRLLLA